MTQLSSVFQYSFFSDSKSKVNSYIKIFIENHLPVKSNQIHVSLTVRSLKSLPPKIEGKSFTSELSSITLLDSSDLTITRSTNLDYFPQCKKKPETVIFKSNQKKFEGDLKIKLW